MKQKLLWIIALAAIFMGFTSCTGPEGNAFLKYSWEGTPQSFYDENPSTPSTVYEGEYFSTESGSFYMEYTAWDGSAWWTSYTITVEPGGVFFSPGPDTWFEITLYSSGPTLYEWDFERSVQGSTEAQQASSIPQVSSRLSENKTRGPVEGTAERTYDFGTIRIEYGRITD